MARSSDDWNRLSFTRGGALIMGVIHVALGCSVLAGGRERFSTTSYSPLLELTSESVWQYGLLYFASGALMFFHRQRVVMSGFALGVLANNIFAGAFVVAMLKYPTASATAWVAYSGFAAIDGILFGQIWSMRHTHKKR